MKNRKEMKKSILDYMDRFLKISEFDLSEKDFDMLSSEIESICKRIAIERVHDTEFTDVMLTEEYNKKKDIVIVHHEILAIEEFEFKGKEYTVICYYEV